MWQFDSFAEWVVKNPFKIHSSRKLLTSKDALPMYRLQTDVATLDFGLIRLDKVTHTRMVRLKNTGYKPIFVHRPEVPSEFAYVGGDIGLLQPGQEISFGVKFTPKSEGDKSGVVLIRAEPTGTISVNLSGSGKPWSFIHNGLFRHNGTQNYDGDSE
jgi:hypothetical protein